MLDQYEGTLKCMVNFNNGEFAECDIVDARSSNPDASIDDEFWLGFGIQVHPERLGLTEEQFKKKYPVGKAFMVELRVGCFPRAGSTLNNSSCVALSGPVAYRLPKVSGLS